MSRNIVLFDIDGTLTESRQKFNSTTLSSSLVELSQVAEIGIVTGSDYNYLKEQLNPLLDSSIRYCLIFYLATEQNTISLQSFHRMTLG